MREPGQVAIQQGLRKMGYSYRKIAAMTGVHHRTVWQHVAAKKGSNVTPWDKRPKEQQNRALKMAEETENKHCPPHKNALAKSAKT